MTKLFPINDFVVTIDQSPAINGDINSYTFIFTTTVFLIDGDVITFEFPPEVALPAPEDLIIVPVPRNNGGSNLVVDVVTVEKQGSHKVSITFVTVAPTLVSYSWQLLNIKNPTYMKPSSQFINFAIYDKNGYFIQSYQKPGPTVVTEQPSNIIIHDLNQASLKPATPTVYTISFTPRNPIPPQGSFIIKWPPQVQIKNDLECSVRTNREYSGVCTVDENSRTITILDVFSSENMQFFSSITIELRSVTNPLQNKDKINGFQIFTFADRQQKYRIDWLTIDVLVPKLKCIYPCSECPESDRTNCLSCWTDSWSNYWYFFYNDQTARGECLPECPAGYTRNGEDSYVCIKCDSTCATCLDTDKFFCVDCHPAFPCPVLNQPGVCLESCMRGFYRKNEPAFLNQCLCDTCKYPCVDCFNSADNCIACDPNGEFPLLYNNQCISLKIGCPRGYTEVNNECRRCTSPCARCEGTPNFCTFCDGTLGRNILYRAECLAECPSGTIPKKLPDDEVTC